MYWRATLLGSTAVASSSAPTPPVLELRGVDKVSVTTLAGDYVGRRRRMALFDLSATSAMPAPASIAIPTGRLKRAAAPTPSLKSNNAIRRRRPT